MLQSDTPLRKNKFRSISFVIFLAFVGLSSLILLIEGTISVYTNFHKEQDLIFIKQEEIAEENGQKVQEYIKEKFILMDSVAVISDLDKKPVKEQQIILTKLLNKDPAFRQITLFNTKKEQLVHVSRSSSFYTKKIDNMVDNELFPHALLGEFHVSNSYIDLNTSEPMILLAIPIKDSLGDISNILVSEVNLKHMWEIVSNNSEKENIYVYVVDREGNLLAFKDTARVLKRENLKHLYEVQEFLENNNSSDNDASVVTRGINGTTVVSTYFRISDEPSWALIVEEPIYDAYKPIILEIARLILILIVTLAGAILVSIFLSKRITGPIIQLNAAAQKMSSGDLNTKIEVISNDEIGELSETFNQMAKQLKESYGMLEAKVKEKTVALEMKIAESDRFNKLMLGRELKMIELKKELQKLKQEMEGKKT